MLGASSCPLEPVSSLPSLGQLPSGPGRRSLRSLEASHVRTLVGDGVSQLLVCGLGIPAGLGRPPLSHARVIRASGALGLDVAREG